MITDIDELRLNLAQAFIHLTKTLNRNIDKSRFGLSDSVIIHTCEIQDDMEYIRWGLSQLAMYEAVYGNEKSVWEQIKLKGGFVPFNPKH